MTWQPLELDRQEQPQTGIASLGLSPEMRNVLTGWAAITVVLLLCLGGVALLYKYSRCLDGCGPYHNTSSVADLDNDGDLDVVLANLRHETETIIWAGPTLWLNQGDGTLLASN